MRRSIRNTLGLAAASAALVVGIPALATSAGATAKTATTASYDHDYDENFGWHYSKWYDGSRAKAKGHVYDDGDYFHVEGKLYDKYSPSWLCGYVQVKFENADGDESNYWAKKCGSSGYKNFHFQEDDVDNIQLRVCYYDQHHSAKKYCGRWDYIYETDEDE